MTGPADIVMGRDVVTVGIKDFHPVRTTTQHIVYGSEGAMRQGQGTPTGIFYAARIIPPFKVNNAHSLFVANFRVAVLEYDPCDVAHRLRSDGLCFFLEKGQVPFPIGPVGTAHMFVLRGVSSRLTVTLVGAKPFMIIEHFYRREHYNSVCRPTRRYTPSSGP